MSERYIGESPFDQPEPPTDYELAASDLTIFAPSGEELVTNARITPPGGRRFIRKHRAHQRANEED